MSALDWIITLAAIVAALEMKDALHWQRFTDALRDARPKGHTFN